MNFEQFVEILDAFEAENWELMMRPGFAGVSILPGDEEVQPVVELGWDESEGGSFVAESELRPVSFRGQELVVEQIQCEMMRAMSGIYHGTMARGRDLIGYGTVGLFFRTSHASNDVYAISNWHVFCPRGNDTPLGSLVEAAEVNVNGSFGRYRNVGNLVKFEEVHGGRLTNEWDLAIAKVSDPSIVRYAYPPHYENIPPTEFYPSGVDLPKGMKLITSGAKEPHTKRGTFRAIGTHRVKYHDGSVYSFRNQIETTPMTDPGDSGSVVCTDDGSRKVVGLMFAGSKERSLANPLYQYPLSQTGISMVGGYDIPVLDISGFNEPVVDTGLSSVGLGDSELLEAGTIVKSSGPVAGDLFPPKLGNVIQAPHRSNLSRRILDRRGAWLKLEWGREERTFEDWIVGWLNVNSPEWLWLENSRHAARYS